MDNNKEILERIEERLDKIFEILENRVTKNCEKMSNHIDFIDTVYDNVKSPLAYICNKVKSIAGSSETTHSLDMTKSLEITHTSENTDSLEGDPLL